MDKKESSFFVIGLEEDFLSYREEENFQFFKETSSFCNVEIFENEEDAIEVAKKILIWSKINHAKRSLRKWSEIHDKKKPVDSLKIYEFQAKEISSQDIKLSFSFS